MIDKARHVLLRDVLWSADEAAEAIEEIVADALGHLDAQRFWPAHPLDDGVSDGNTSFYFGATGVMWALDYLGRVGATKAGFDFHSLFPGLLQANRAIPTPTTGTTATILTINIPATIPAPVITATIPDMDITATILAPAITATIPPMVTARSPTPGRPGIIALTPPVIIHMWHNATPAGNRFRRARAVSGH